MFNLLEKFFEWRFNKMLKPFGYHVTSLEFLPDEPRERIARITPLGDGFEHTGDDCFCDPVRTTETQDNGEEYVLIQHRRMNDYGS